VKIHEKDSSKENHLPSTLQSISERVPSECYAPEYLQNTN
jgi:hypothetical protein